MRLLIIGDIMGKPGMQAVKRGLPRLVAERELDFVIANGENAAGGVGLTAALTKELFDQGVHCVTTGNHVWRQGGLGNYIQGEPRLLRPLNFPASQPGDGVGIFETPAGVRVGVMNLIGRVFMDPADNPFPAALTALERLREADVVVADMHAEATSEKRAMGFQLDGRAAAVVGTHTHIQTADEKILPGGTAYITDVGMTGPHDSVLGMRKEPILERFNTGMPVQFRTAKHDVRLQALFVEVDVGTGLASAVERVDLVLED